MEHFLTTNFLEHLSYLGLYVSLGGTGIPLPVPEEVILITAGFLTARGIMLAWIAIPVAISAVLVQDSVLFFLARKGSSFTKRIHDQALVQGLEKTWVLSPSHPLRAVFFLRFFSGLRLLSPVFAGLNKARYRDFLLVDFLGLSIFVPTIFSLGYIFHVSFRRFKEGLYVFHHYLLYISIVAVSVFALVFLYRFLFSRRQARKNKD